MSKKSSILLNEDLLEMKKKFGDARRTILSHDTSSMDMEGSDR